MHGLHGDLHGGVCMSEIVGNYYVLYVV